MAKYLREAEEQDKYLEECYKSQTNRFARKNLQYTVWHDQTDAAIIEHDFQLKAKGVKVVILNPSADGGMPHTRGTNIICLPAYIRENESLLKETIQHELIHIDQKQRPEFWQNKLLEEGWLLNVGHALPFEVKERCRINPDTLQFRFPAWEGRYVPLPYFEREDKPTLRDIRIQWWDTEDEIIKINPPRSYIRKYGNQNSSSMEHPFELYAYK